MMMMTGQQGKGYQGDDATANDGFFAMYNSEFLFSSFSAALMN
jgi:hypothetical protein